jgi:hypothetical protein
MTLFYSDHFSADQGETGHYTTKLSPDKIVTVGKKHSRIRRTAAYYTIPASTDMADNDEIHYFDMKSGDRLINLFFSQDANQGATATYDLGVYLKSTGLEVDDNLFAAADDWAGAIAREDLFTQATTLDNWDRGKTLWELAAIGGGSDTVDPQVMYTIVATATANITVVDDAVETLVEAYYIAGD